MNHEPGTTGRPATEHPRTTRAERRRGPGQTRSRGRGPTRRRIRGSAALRALRREIPGTVAVLADRHDFTTMGRYRTFRFHDHDTYLRHLDALLRGRTTARLHTELVVFDPDDFAEFCAEEDITADSPGARSSYTAALAARGESVPHTGRPLRDQLPALTEHSARRATWEYAAALLATIGTCAECGQDIGSASFTRATHLLTKLLEAAGPGGHQLVCSIRTPEERLLATLRAECDPLSPLPRIDAAEGTEFLTVLAAGVATGGSGGLVLRTTVPGRPDRLHGWRLHGGDLLPLTEAEVFSAYCTDALTGEPLPPEPGAEYRAGFPVPADPQEGHH
jgi:hypothetical protein